MQRTATLLAYFFLCTTCFAQQYPFVHYTPRDGLISNQVLSIYQDNKGRMYFTSANGLSVYDGARFTNYTTASGLDNDIVNCIMEMGDDSIWVVTNNGMIQCLANGKLKMMNFDESPPIINNLIRDNRGKLYAASEQGLFLFSKNRFEKLPFTDLDGRDINRYIANIIPFGNLLLVVRDNFLLGRDERFFLYLYDPQQKKIIAQTQKGTIFLIAKAPDGRVWASINGNILEVDTAQLKKGKIVLNQLPALFSSIKNHRLGFISFDQYSNCWLTDRASVLKKISPGGEVTTFTKTSGLSTIDVGHIFLDKEGTTWIASFKTGVDKLVHNNFSFLPDPFGLDAVYHISYAAGQDRMLLFSIAGGKLVVKGANDRTRELEIKNAHLITQVIETPNGIFGISDQAIYKLVGDGNALRPQAIFTDTIDNLMSNPMVDKNGNLVICGSRYLTAVVDGMSISRHRINYFTDQVVSDTSGAIWTVTRAGELLQFTTDPGNPGQYLEQKFSLTKGLSGINPRSFIIDRNNHFLIGSRSSGLYVFKLINGALIRQFHITAAMGLSDNFISYLAVDADNNIWACSPLGLDKISIRNAVPVIENITKQNSIYQSVSKVAIDRTNTAWALLSGGIIKITPEKRLPAGYSPSLMVNMVKAGKDTVTKQTQNSLTHRQNNLNFYFSATSFLDEKQVLYSYRLLGGGNTQWSEPSNNTTVSFIDLHPGSYVLEVKANFPAGRYPEQAVQYPFSILPPWWQTWWFRTVAGLLVIGLIAAGIHFYYRRKLDKKMAALEKQQAIEKERTRIAIDMHDDLGAGLSRIKFLSENIKVNKGNGETLMEDIGKISAYSNEMAEKMGEIVWALNQKNDTIADLVAFTRSYAKEYLSGQSISCDLDTPLDLPSVFITGELRQHLFLSVKECLHNIVKHARASQVYVSIKLNGAIEIVIHDNGKGINWDQLRPFSNGIENIRKRMNEIGGSAVFQHERGTKVTLSVPYDV